MEIEGIRIKRFNLEKEISTAPQLRVSGFSWLVIFLLSLYPSQSEHEEFQISHPS